MLDRGNTVYGVLDRGNTVYDVLDRGNTVYVSPSQALYQLTPVTGLCNIHLATLLELVGTSHNYN